MYRNPTTIQLNELIRLNQPAQSLRLRASHIHARQTGQYLSRFKGRGMEFDESRPYQPGDDARNIDWRVTARTGKPHTKLFHEERERPVFIGIDNRVSMAFATHGSFKSVIAAECAALMAWAASQQGDRIGGVIFTDEGHHEFRPQRGKRGVLPLLNALASQSSSPATSPAAHNPAESLSQALARLHRITHPGSLVCLVSDFRGIDTAAISRLSDISRHNDVVLIHVYDPLESRLPQSGQYRMTDGQRLLQINTGEKAFQETYRTRFLSLTRQLDELSKKYRLQYLSCQTHESPLEILQQAFGLRINSARKTG